MKGFRSHFNPEDFKNNNNPEKQYKNTEIISPDYVLHSSTAIRTEGEVFLTADSIRKADVLTQHTELLFYFKQHRIRLWTLNQSKTQTSETLVRASKEGAAEALTEKNAKIAQNCSSQDIWNLSWLEKALSFCLLKSEEGKRKYKNIRKTVFI